MTRVKVCGLTRECDVRTAAALGADALGFILAPSPRRVTLERAASLVRGLAPFVSRVAVLSDPTEAELREVIESRLFDCLQFHGREEPGRLAGLPGGRGRPSTGRSCRNGAFPGLSSWPGGWDPRTFPGPSKKSAPRPWT